MRPSCTDETTGLAQVESGARRFPLRFRDYSLRTKLTLLIMGMCCFTLLSPSVVFLIHERGLAQREIGEELTILSGVIADHAAYAIHSNQTEELHDLLEHLAVEPNIRLGEIHTNIRSPLVRYQRSQRDSVLHCMEPMTSGIAFHADHVHKRTEIVHRGVSLGFVHLISSLDELDDRIENSAFTVFAAGLISLVLCLLISMRLQRGFIRPILDLSSLAERVSAENDFSLRSTHRSGDEVGVLATEFNTMLTRVQLTAKALQAARDTLEQRVQLRTRELEREVTERRSREAELRESQARLQEEKNERHRLAVAVEQSPEGILIAGANGAIEFVNRTFEDLFEVHREQLLYKNAETLRSDDHDDDYYRALYDQVRAGKVWTNVFRRRSTDGRMQVFQVTVSPIRDSDNTISNYVAVCSDVTHELEMEAQLRQSQKLEAVGSLAAGIAHEINTPIQFIGDNLQFMKSSFDDLLCLLRLADGAIPRPAPGEESEAEARYREMAKSVGLDFLQEEIPRAVDQTQAGVDRVATIVHAMKRFSHPDQGIQKSLANINDALTNTLTVARNELKYVSDLVLELDPDLPMVNCHLGELNQVFLNLLINAAHAVADRLEGTSGKKGAITVRTRRTGDDVVIEIADTGTGIPPDIQDRVFDPFFTTKGVGKGTGQGLAIARAVVVDKHGGDIQFQTVQGEGTTFSIRLPISGAPALPTSEQRARTIVEAS